MWRKNTLDYRKVRRQIVMKFEDICYAERIGKYGKTLGLSMPGGFPVFKSTMELAWACVNKNWTNIDWSVKQTSKTMIGEEHWGAPEEKGFNQALGRCIRFFVKHDMLPLTLDLARTREGKPYKGGNRRYVLAHTVTVNPLPVMKIPAARIDRNREVLALVDWAALQQPTQPNTIGNTLP
jgi:hypothetical protein